MLSASVDAEGR